MVDSVVEVVVGTGVELVVVDAIIILRRMVKLAGKAAALKTSLPPVRIVIYSKRKIDLSIQSRVLFRFK